MNFDLKTPCKDCPFRTDVRGYLTAARAREIIDAITRQQQTFACHKTVQHDEDGEHIPRTKEQHCAGATILLERLNLPNQMMRIAERLGFYDRSKVDMDAPVFRTAAAMIAHMKKGRVRA